MAGINYPIWRQLKINVVTALEAIAIEENAVDPGRNFVTTRDRWRPWIESQQGAALVNVMVQNVSGNSDRSANRMNKLDTIAVMLDMYAVGKAGEILPIDQVAADRLDLLTAQVREAITRLKGIDLGFSEDPEGGMLIDWNGAVALTIWDQDQEDSTGQYAPARWTFEVNMPFIPTDNNDYVNLDQLNLDVKSDTLELFKMQFNYTP